MVELNERRVGDWLVQPSLNRVSRGSEAHSLPKRFMDLLVFLADNQGTVVSKEEITEAVWQREYVSEGTLTHAIAVIRQTLGDETKQPRFIETIPTRGYRLIAPVAAGDARRAAAQPGRTAVRRWRFTAAALALVVVAVSTAISVHLLAGGKAPAAQRGGRLAVLPFDNLGSEDRAYLASGLTDDLTTRLASVPGLSVISRLSALSCGRSGKSAREVGRELGADYLLVGTTRWERDGAGQGAMWVNAQLVSAGDDTHLWGASYSRPIGSVFDIEADIAAQVVARLGLAVAEPLRRRLEDRPTQNVDAYQAYLCAVDHARFETYARLGLAQAMFERATQLDPGFARAWAELGVLHIQIYQLHFDHTEERLSRAREAIDRALTLAPDLAEGHRALGAYLLLGRREYEKAAAELQEAGRQLPNDSELGALVAELDRRRGRWEKARAELEELSSRDPRNPVISLSLGDVLSALRRWGAADIAYRQATSAMPDAVHPYLRRFWNTLCQEGPSRRAAAALDDLPQPDQPEALFSRFFLSYFRRDFDAALAVLDRAGEGEISSPSMPMPRALLECLCLNASGRPEPAAHRCQAALAALGQGGSDDPGVGLARGYALVLLGRREAAVREAIRATALCPLGEDAVDGAAYLAEAARIFALAGDAARSAEAVSLLLSRPSPLSVASIEADPRFDRVRSDPRFVAALDESGRASR